MPNDKQDKPLPMSLLTIRSKLENLSNVCLDCCDILGNTEATVECAKCPVKILTDKSKETFYGKR